MGADNPLILVVDDDHATQGVIAAALSKLGYVCMTAANGLEAMELVSSNSFGLIMTDLDMPRMDGLELISCLRDAKSDVPVIVGTAHSDFESAQKALRLGVADYIVKPFGDLSELMAAARRAVETGSSRGAPEDLAEEFIRRWEMDNRPDGGAARLSDHETAGYPIRLGGFELIEVIAEGGMGTVYRALQKSVLRTVAVKILKDDLARDKEYIARFIREARVVARLDHENIVKCIDMGCDDGLYYIAMEYVDGEPLDLLMLREGSVDEQLALDIAVQIVRALAHIWLVGVVHRDIKPANIMLTQEGTAKLMDLGLAKSTSGAAFTTSAGIAVGTPAYMSPEQAKGNGTTDLRSDIYSLGVTLYHLVAGEPPFEGDDPTSVLRMHLERTPEPAHIRNPKVSRNLSAVLAKMMDKDLDLRYSGPKQLLEDMELLRAGEPPRHASATG
jgi:CheY-like chemotaxis protein/tRNA A-37 threonylcarbamoyl transferase component Bud32